MPAGSSAVVDSSVLVFDYRNTTVYSKKEY